MTETPEMRALKTIKAMHNADGRRMVGFPRATEPQDYCTGCGLPAPCPTMMVLSDVPEAKPHDKWVDIDWIRADPHQPPIAASFNVEPCTCETPWRHYP